MVSLANAPLVNYPISIKEQDTVAFLSFSMGTIGQIRPRTDTVFTFGISYKTFLGSGVVKSILVSEFNESG